MNNQIRKTLFFDNFFVQKLIRALLILLPDKNFFVNTLQLLTLFLIFVVFFVIFYSSGSSHVISAESPFGDNIDTTMDGAFSYLTGTFGGQLFNCFYGNTPIGKTSGNDIDCSDGSVNQANIQALMEGTYAGPLLWRADGGAIGRIVNSSRAVVSLRVLNPGETALYYAKQAKNEVYAQSIDIQSGRNVLAPVFFLYETTKNLALSIVVIILLAGAFSILISNLTFSESKLNIVQLFMNTGITTVFILLYYEIAAIIYDLTVNYGNALVVGVLSPYINARTVLERLQPGGDLSIMALFSTMYFVGVNDALLVVLKSISSYFEPVLYQTASATMGLLPSAATSLVGDGAANLIGTSISFLSGFVVGLFIPGIKYVLSSKPLFDTIVAFIIFVMQFRIFFSLLSSFVNFVLMTGFGPIMIVNSGINEGWENGILPKLKMLAANGLVFPVTFFFILLAAITFNIRIPDRIIDDQASVRKEQICSFDTVVSNKSPEVNSRANSLYSAQYYDHKLTNTVNQTIFDTVPAYEGSCMPAFFSMSWMYFPAPLGIIGPPAEQPLVVTGLIMTFLGIGFIVIASVRVNQFISELLNVKPEFQAFDGIVGDAMGVVKSMPGVAALTLPVALPIAGFAVGQASKLGGKFWKSGAGRLLKYLDSKYIPSNNNRQSKPASNSNQEQASSNAQSNQYNIINRFYLRLRSFLTGSGKIGRERYSDYYDQWFQPRSYDLTGVNQGGRILPYSEYMNQLSNDIATKVGRQSGFIGPDQTTTLAQLPSHLQPTAYQLLVEATQKTTQGLTNVATRAQQLGEIFQKLGGQLTGLMAKIEQVLRMLDTFT